MRPLVLISLLAACGEPSTKAGGAAGGAADGACTTAGWTCPEDGIARYCVDTSADPEDTECAAEDTCDTVQGCASCDLDVAVGGSDPALAMSAGAFLPLDDRAISPSDFGWERLKLRPIQIAASRATGLVTLTAGDGVALWSEDGAALTPADTLDASQLPTTVYAQGTTLGDTDITATWSADTGCETRTTLPIRVGLPDARVGRSLASSPGFETVEAYHSDEQVEVALDAAVHADRAGLAYDVYIVPHRTPEEWADDTSLSDAGDGAESLTAPTDGLQISTAWASDLPTPALVVSTGWDVIWDFGQDGQLDPGDLSAGPGDDAPGFSILADLTQPGPHAVLQDNYAGGAWLGQRTYWPDDIQTFDTPAPIVIISHGNGHNYTWYDDLGEHLASWGYVVMAHQNNTGPGIATASTTTLTNTDYFVGNVETLLDGALAGHVDTHRIAWVGHSRGGEGVARAVARIVTENYTPDNFTLDDIALVSSIAPTVFLGAAVSNPYDAPYHLIIAGADGDVNQAPSCPQCQSNRIADVATGPVNVQYVHGAAHNDFNCCGFSDGTGPDQIGRTAAQAWARSSYLTMLQWYLKDDASALDLLRRDPATFPAAGVDANVIVARQWATRDGRRVLDDFTLPDDATEGDPTLSSAGTAVASTVSNLVEGRTADGDGRLLWTDADPMNGMTGAYGPTERGAVAVFDWDDAATWELTLPDDAQDLTGWTAVSLRACQGTRHPQTIALDGPLTFSVTIEDADGLTATVPLAPFGELPDVYPRTGEGRGEGWVNEWVTVRVKISDFARVQPTLDLQNVQTLRLEFGGDAGSAVGRMGLDDVELSLQ